MVQHSLLLNSSAKVILFEGCERHINEIRFKLILRIQVGLALALVPFFRLHLYGKKKNPKYKVKLVFNQLIILSAFYQANG